MDRHQVSMGLLFLRLGGGALLIYGRSWTWSTMIAGQRHGVGAVLQGSELTWVLTIASEFLCVLMVMLGIFTRFAAVPPLLVMLISALAMPSGTVWSAREHYLLYALPFFVLTFTGPGDYSVEGSAASWARSR